MPSLSPAALRKAAFAAAVAGVTLASAAMPSFAQQKMASSINGEPPITTSTNCRDWMPTVLGASARCEITKGKLLEAEIKRLKAEGKKVDAQNRHLDAENRNIEARTRANREQARVEQKRAACFDGLNSEVDAILAKRPLTAQEKADFKGQMKKCEKISSL